jgi:glutaredoxin 3
LQQIVYSQRSVEMAAKHKVEVFSAGCVACDEAITLIKRVAGTASEVVVHDMKSIDVARRAKALGVRSVPAVVIDGKLADCCAGRGVDEAILRAAGLGRTA